MYPEEGNVWLDRVVFIGDGLRSSKNHFNNYWEYISIQGTLVRGNNFGENISAKVIKFKNCSHKKW